MTSAAGLAAAMLLGVATGLLLWRSGRSGLARRAGGLIAPLAYVLAALVGAGLAEASLDPGIVFSAAALAAAASLASLAAAAAMLRVLGRGERR